ncbi:MAG: ankyrin repeat domain-containing protein [Rubrivivax sp.]
MKHIYKFLQAIVLIAFTAISHAGAYEDFFRSVEIDDARTLTRLLQRGFDPNTPDPQGQVGLFLALRGGSGQVVQALLEHPDLKVDAANTSEETPLMMAALRGALEPARRLIERGARLERPGWTPLHYAASGPEVAMVRLLLERGAPIDARSPNGTTPLMMAARYGTEDAATLLLERGADVSLRNQLDLGPADFARAAGREALARRLEGLPRR